MKKDLKHFYTRFKKQIVIAGALLLIVVLYGIFGGSTSNQVTLPIHAVDFTDSVLVSGKIVSAQKSDLGFDQSGRISAVYVKVGDVVKKGTLLASVDNTDLVAQVAQKKSALDIQQAKLDTLITGNRPEEITLYQQKYADASDALLVAHHSAFLGAQDAILNKADTLFTNGNTVNPVIAIRTQSTNEKLSIEQERIAVREALTSWESILTQASSSVSTSSLISLTTKSTQALSLVKTFLSHLSVIVGNLSTGNSGLSASAVDTYTTTVNSASQEVSSALNADQTALTAWNASRDSLTLEVAGSTASDVQAGQAQVASAQADLDAARAKLAKASVIAPFDGVVTRMDAKIGSVISPSDVEISMMSSGIFNIESYVPEVYIASIVVGDRATTTLDAYGPDVTFGAHVISVDPAETIRDGVSTYKVVLQFDGQDARLRSGMTANASIVTTEIPHAIVIPRGSVIEVGGTDTVKVISGRAITSRVVEMTPVALGKVQITKGLADGEVIMLDPTH